MSMFNLLGSGESLFRDSVALDYDYLPKVIKHRKKEQQMFASAIRPLLNDRSGRNMLISGRPGVGKTAICKHMLRILGEETDDTSGFYVNCWKHNSSYKVMLELCQLLGLRFVVNKKTSELFDLVKKRLNKTGVVLIFDEVDKVEDFDFLYMLLEDVYKKSIFLITNFPKKIEQLDKRIISRFNPESLNFHPYTEQETKDILSYRMKYAFIAGVWEDEAFDKLAKQTAKIRDIRTGLYAMREAGTIAEERASKKIQMQDVDKALSKIDKYSKNKHSELDVELQEILALVQEGGQQGMGELFREYQERGGVVSYKSFTRKIKKLSAGQYISTEKSFSPDGNTTLVKVNKKLTDY